MYVFSLCNVYHDFLVNTMLMPSLHPTDHDRLPLVEQKKITYMKHQFLLLICWSSCCLEFLVFCCI